MPRTESAAFDVQPRYFELLSDEDKESYMKLKTQLSSPNCKNRRNKSHEVFKEIVASIKRFSIKGDDSDWKRSLVCGVLWLDHSIAINTHQLRLLITKCKSSINGSFQALGYGTVPTGTEASNELLSKFPFLRNNFAELRQWTVRQMIKPVDKGLEDENNENKDFLKAIPIKKLVANKEKQIIQTASNLLSSIEPFGVEDEITPPPDLMTSDPIQVGDFSFSFGDFYDQMKPINDDFHFQPPMLNDDPLMFFQKDEEKGDFNFFDLD